MESEKVSDKLEKSKYSNTLIKALNKLFLIINNGVFTETKSKTFPGEAWSQTL